MSILQQKALDKTGEFGKMRRKNKPMGFPEDTNSVISDVVFGAVKLALHKGLATHQITKDGRSVLVFSSPLPEKVYVIYNTLNGGMGIDTDKENKMELETPPTKFQRPTFQEVCDYVNLRLLNVDPKKFFDYYDAGDWIDGKGKRVRNWKQKILVWHSSTSGRGMSSGRDRSASLTPHMEKFFQSVFKRKPTPYESSSILGMEMDMEKWRAGLPDTVRKHIFLHVKHSIKDYRVYLESHCNFDGLSVNMLRTDGSIFAKFVKDCERRYNINFRTGVAKC